MPSSLATELTNEKRTRLKAALKAGSKYVWCALKSARNAQRDAMRDKARELEKSLKLAPEQIEFRWRDQLTDLLNQHPQLAAVHLPAWGSAFADARPSR